MFFFLRLFIFVFLFFFSGIQLQALQCKSLLLNNLSLQNETLFSASPGGQVRKSRPSFHHKPKEALRVMSYNVQNLEHYRGKYDWQGAEFVKSPQDTYSGDKAEWQRREIAGIIKESDPDILLLHEVEGRQAAQHFVKDYLNNRYAVFMPETNDKREIGTAFLISDRLSYYVRVHDFNSINWTTPAGNIEPVFTRNAALYELFDIKSGEARMAVFGVHYKSRRDRQGDPKSIQKRAKEIELTARELERWSEEHPELPFLVMGDFNAGRRYGESEEMASSLDLFDPFLDSEVFKDEGGLGLITHSYHPEERPLPKYSSMDYALLSSHLKGAILASSVYRYKSDGKLKRLPKSYEERSQNPSDHYPIYFDINRRATSL